MNTLRVVIGRESVTKEKYVAVESGNAGVRLSIFEWVEVTSKDLSPADAREVAAELKRQADAMDGGS